MELFVQLSKFFLAQYSQESIIRYFGTIYPVRKLWHNTMKFYESMIRCFGTEFRSDFRIRFFAQFSQEFIKRYFGTIQQKSSIWFLGTF